MSPLRLAKTCYGLEATTRALSVRLGSEITLRGLPGESVTLTNARDNPIFTPNAKTFIESREARKHHG